MAKPNVDADGSICSIDKLANDVLLYILSELVPIETITSCKFVCKKWNKLLAGVRGTMIFLVSSPGQRNVKLYFEDIFKLLSNMNPVLATIESLCFKTCATEILHQPVNKIKVRTQGNKKAIAIGSRAGLVCISRPHHGLSDPTHVCNPMTFEYTNLPQLSSSLRGGYVVSGFGHLPECKQFKVLRIYYPSTELRDLDNAPLGMAQVVTLGFGGSSNTWRDVGVIKTPLWQPGIQSGETLYFMGPIDCTIVTFNLQQENFGQLEPPPCLQQFENSIYHLQELNGVLYFIHQLTGRHIHLWAQGEHDSWVTAYTIEWPWKCPYDYFQPIALTAREEILFWVNCKLCVYDSKTSTFKINVDLNPGNKLAICQAICYESSDKK
ncbi:putative F-box protein At1g70380 [Papaver somniferum]|uniref:putative F-box protein At1g70380 n=1 Tax=Papaver somniferum TaxID=3469 RepID=UPI000E6F48CF|nr:putative F-box protein At1g70380 [Papaver somniferum]